MENTITFNYMPYIQHEAFQYSLNTVRTHYPESDIFVYIDSFRDDISIISNIANSYDCKIFIRNQPVFFIDRKDSLETNIPKMIEINNRYTNTCTNTNAEWIVIMEEDVIIKRPIQVFPSADVGVCRSEYTRPSGGSIFKRKVFLDAVQNVDIVDIMLTVHNAYYASDVVLEHLFYRNGATFEEWIEYADKGYKDDKPHAIYHGYKDLYKYY